MLARMLSAIREPPGLLEFHVESAEVWPKVLRARSPPPVTRIMKVMKRRESQLRRVSRRKGCLGGGERAYLSQRM